MEDTKPDLKEDAPAAGGSFLDASNILVFHPGSRSLRLGRSCQAVPHTMLNVIARKRRRNVEKSLGKTFQEPFIKKTVPAYK